MPSLKASNKTSSYTNESHAGNAVCDFFCATFFVDSEKYSYLCNRYNKIHIDMIDLKNPKWEGFHIINKDGKTTFQFRTPSEGGVVIDSVASLVEEL